MPKQPISASELERSFARATQLQAELACKERAVGRRVSVLAKALAALMKPGDHLYRRGVGIHAFESDGAMCLTAAYLEPERDDFRYRYAILCGGEAAKRALRTAPIDPSDSDEPGSRRRIVMATYDDYDDFLFRLPTYLADVTRDFEKGIEQTAGADSNVRSARGALVAAKRHRGRGAPLP
jgi:hypothetical protein